MAIKINLKRNNEVKEGYVGFSYTTGLFGFFVPLFRGDFKYFGIMFIIELIITALSFISFGVLSFLFLFFQIYFGFKYNEYYTKNLISLGFIPENESDYAALFIYGYTDKRIDGINFSSYKLNFDKQEFSKKLMYVVYLVFTSISIIIGYIILFMGIGFLSFMGLSNIPDGENVLNKEQVIDIKQDVLTESKNSNVETISIEEKAKQSILNEKNFEKFNPLSNIVITVPKSSFKYNYESDGSMYGINIYDSRIKLYFSGPLNYSGSLIDEYNYYLNNLNKYGKPFYTVLRENKNFFVIYQLSNDTYYYTKVVTDGDSKIEMSLEFPKEYYGAMENDFLKKLSLGFKI